MHLKWVRKEKKTSLDTKSNYRKALDRKKNKKQKTTTLWRKKKTTLKCGWYSVVVTKSNWQIIQRYVILKL